MKKGEGARKEQRNDGPREFEGRGRRERKIDECERVAGVISHPSPGRYNGCYHRDEGGTREG